MGIDYVRFWIDFVRFLAEGDPKPHLKEKTIHFRRDVIYGLFRTALSPVPTSSIGGKVTAERVLDDYGTDDNAVRNNPWTTILPTKNVVFTS